jgi:Icc-related predicted phosphoesterase
MLVLGDAHADDPARREALLAAYRATEPEAALQVGDLLHYDLPAPTWFVAGNNEEFDVIDAHRRGDSTLTTAERPHLLDGGVAAVSGLRVAGLSGTHAPTRYDASRDELAGERRRHFVRSEVERAMSLSDVDVFLTHAAPHGLLRVGGRDPGCAPVDEILRAVEPALCLVGHYHRHAEATVGGTRVVSLAPAWEGYYALDPETLELDRHPRPDLDPDEG